MSQAMTSMASLLGSSKAVMEGSLQLSGSTRLSTGSCNRVTVGRPVFSVGAQQLSFETETSRRAVLGVAAVGLSVGFFAKDVLAAANSIKIGPPPPPSGGLRKIYDFVCIFDEDEMSLLFMHNILYCSFEILNEEIYEHS